MYKAYKFRLYPNDNQRVLIHKTFGCVRLVYNYFLDKCKSNGYIKAYDMCSMLKELYCEYPFLKEVDSCSLRCAIFNLEDSYKNFFSKRRSILNLRIGIVDKHIELIVCIVPIKEKNIIV